MESVTIDLSHAHFWDITSVEALDKVVVRFRRLDIEVSVAGTNSASSTLIDQFVVFDKPDLLDKLHTPAH